MTDFKLERRVPLAVVATLVLQTGAALVWAGAAEQRLAGVERAVEMRAGAPERLARVEEQITAMREQLKRIEGKLDALGGR
jgi:hypothetical protein